MIAEGSVHARALACAALLLAGPAAFGERDAAIRIRPEPIGAAKNLTSARSTADGAMPELPVDSLVPAELPVLQTRAGTLTSTATTTKISTIGDLATISTVKQPIATVTTTTTTSTAIKTTQDPRLTTLPTLGTTSDLSRTGSSSGSTSSISKDTTVSSSLPVRVGTLPELAPGIRVGGTTGGTSNEAPPPGSDPPPPGDPAPPADESVESAAEKAKRERLPPEQIAQIVVERLQLLAQIREERLAREELEKQQRDRIDGPSALGAVNLLEGLHVDPKVSLDVADILRVEHELYQDGNPKSGRFYYLPARYDLAWDPEHQYALTVIYGNAESEGAEGQVLMAARLQSGVDSRELDVVRELLRAYVRRHAKEREVRFEALAPFALAGTTDLSLFGGAQNEFTIPPDQVSVQGASELLGAIDVSWAADQRRLLNVESLLRTKAGIHGEIGLLGAGEARLARAIPLSIDVASPRTFGRIAFDRAGGYRNATHYPLRFRTLHALVLARKSKGRVREGDPVVYSWDLSDTRVPAGSSVVWDAQEIPAWLDSRALLQWVDYTVEGKCDTCDALVFDERFIPSAAATRSVVMTSTDVLAATGAARLAVRIRSKHLTPARELAALPQAMITEDGAPKTMARLFLSDVELAADEPIYEYQLELTFPDGRSFAGSAWTPTRNLDLLPGSESVRRLVGLPSDSPPAP